MNTSEQIIRQAAAKSGLSIEISEHGVYLRDPNTPKPTIKTLAEYWAYKDAMLDRLCSGMPERGRPDPRW